jgi:hypothetical protein
MTSAIRVFPTTLSSKSKILEMPAIPVAMVPSWSAVRPPIALISVTVSPTFNAEVPPPATATPILLPVMYIAPVTVSMVSPSTMPAGRWKFRVSKL